MLISVFELFFLSIYQLFSQMTKENNLPAASIISGCGVEQKSVKKTDWDGKGLMTRSKVWKKVTYPPAIKFGKLTKGEKILK
jgi:hypothetical protein